MNQILRNGADSAVALASGAKRQHIAVARDDSSAPAATPAQVAGATASPAPAGAMPAARSGPMRLLRAPLRPLYRVCLPFARPLLFRLRAYMSHLLRLDVAHLVFIQQQEAQGQRRLLQEIKAMQGTLQDEIKHLQGHIQHEMSSGMRKLNHSLQELGAGQPGASTPAASAGQPAQVGREAAPAPARASVASQIVVIGAGGHAKVCIELLQGMGESVAYCVGGDDSPDRCLDVPVLKGDDHLARLRQQGYRRLFVAIGSNRLRERLAAIGTGLGYELANAISQHAVVSPSASLGRGVALMAGVVINAEAQIADLAIINTGATVDHDCRIGRAAHLAPQCALAGNVTVGARSFLGVGCKVIPEIDIGEQVTVGAGGVVVRNIMNDAMAIGVPARVK